MLSIAILPEPKAKPSAKDAAGSDQWTAEQKARHAMQTKARLASTESDGALDVAQPRAETRAAAKLARTEESEGVAEILKEEGLLDVDAMQQLDILVSP